MKEFEGKLAMVTGGSRGIGQATALAFARKGAQVAIADVLVEAAHETVQMIKDMGGEAFFEETDVSKASEVKRFIDHTVKRCGRLDCAFNNAGIEGLTVPTAEYPEEMWERVIGVNLTGVWLCMKYELQQMLKQGKGAIVNMSSIAGIMAISKISPYNASKFGVIGITKTAALEYATQGIRVNAMCPGWINTPLNVQEAIDLGVDPDEWLKNIGNYAPIKRLGTPEEIAEAVLWLCSDAASFVTGHAMCVDGAITAGWLLE